MNREIKFRGKSKETGNWVYGSLNIEFDGTTHIVYWVSKLLEPANNYYEMVHEMVEVDPETVGQYTGLQDKNGVEIYEADVVRWRKPYRTTQTHTGDNIPNGSYTEPMEPAIATIKATVAFKDGMFTGELLEDYSSDIMHRYDDMPFPLCYDNHYYTEQDIKDAISVHKPSMDIWDSPEEGNLQYLLEEYNLKNIDELLSYVSGIEVVGNIYQNPELIKTI